jgi:propionate CoA-transferase
MRLEAEGVVVTEIAPGVNLERDILAQANFPLKVSANLREMPAFLFESAPMGRDAAREAA